MLNSSVFENKSQIEGIVSTPAIPRPSGNLVALRSQLAVLEAREKQLVGELQAAEERVAACRLEFDQAQTSALTGEDPIECLQASQLPLNEAIAAIPPLTEKVGTCRALITRARREITATEDRIREAYRMDLANRHQACATKMAASLGQFMSDSLEFQRLHDEAFAAFPKGDRPEAPAAFFSHLRPFVQTGARRPAWSFLDDFVHMYGLEALPASGSEYLLNCVDDGLTQREDEARCRKTAQVMLDGIKEHKTRLQEDAMALFFHEVK